MEEPGLRRSGGTGRWHWGKATTGNVVSESLGRKKWNSNIKTGWALNKAIKGILSSTSQRQRRQAVGWRRMEKGQDMAFKWSQALLFWKQSSSTFLKRQVLSKSKKMFCGIMNISFVWHKLWFDLQPTSSDAWSVGSTKACVNENLWILKVTWEFSLVWLLHTTKNDIVLWKI